MLLRIESCAAVIALLSVGHQSMTWAADSAGAPHEQVLSCSLPHLTILAMVGSCHVTRRMLVLMVPGGRSWKARPSMSRESSRRRRKSAV